VIDFGPAALALLPAESYVEYQLLAQKVRPDDFVLTAGYGECGPGYIPIGGPGRSTTATSTTGAGWPPAARRG
jgi:hypothetical protein